MLREWLARLAPEAAATLVMGRNLGADSLHAWLEKEEGWSVTRLAARSGYRLLRVTAPDDPERMRETPDGQ
jgi:16S rRNA (guanine1207-N2)-methyltransferase